ncbi:tRNA (adenine-N1)-methyltransferase [Ferroplasma acidiphilum]|uniref:Protein-L-isoaspartate O-methyltransferase n=2 Tax=Ferroplasma TaxID=74968 RepID=S0ARL1_FERAC|nr:MULTISPECIES: methyltransferase domain-containing protein [Ferroplasma]AGO61422.1 protein-L-isoaspartate O-methyltransferase [Ferroplasma acidarmanus Fer1]NOL60171.1 methyltransferase domain-containing protein [Ferroplasma acidiphilum]WMT53256.1 MAG: methyltransferase domain-containing protein [Ferroplasma acidiphilum]
MLILKSEEISGILDEKNLIAFFGKDRINLPKNSFIEPGDIVRLKNREFIALKPDSQFFNEISGRNTQAVLPLDTSYIIHAAGILPGTCILEAGAGTGSLSYSILKAIGSKGKLVTMDINKSTIDIARGNVERFMLPDNWETIHGDIRSDNLPGKYDAAILDIPDPWDAVENMKKHIVPGGYLVTYSPNFNQAEKNVIAMKKLNFYVLETVELIKRNIIVRENATRPDNNIIDHTAFISIGVRTSSI